MIKIRKLAELLVAETCESTPGSERHIIAVERQIKELLDGAMCYLLDRPGTRYTVSVEVDARDEFPELQDLNRQFGGEDAPNRSS